MYMYLIALKILSQQMYNFQLFVTMYNMGL